MTATVFLVTLLGAIALGMPIAFATILCAVTLMFAQGSFDTTLISQKLIEGADSYPLLAIPFFIFAGELMNKGGMSRRIVGFALAFVGHVRGGLGLVAVFAAVQWPFANFMLRRANGEINRIAPLLSSDPS